MSRDVLGVATGLAVLITGVIAVVNLIGPADGASAENFPPPITMVSSTEPIPATSVEGLPGVGPAVMRVLQWSGNAGSAGEGDLAQVPPSVAAVLIKDGAYLSVPTISGKLQ